MNCSKKVTIILLNYNGYKDTIECLSSIYSIDYKSFNVICIDNASSDKSVEKITTWSQTKFITYVSSDTILHDNRPNAFINAFDKRKRGELAELYIIKNSENIGFAAGCNQGIQLALSSGAEYIWLLNNDTIIEPDSLSILADYLDENSCFQLATPQIRFYDKPDHIWNCGGVLKWYGVRKYHYVNQPVKNLPQKETLEITFVTGCAPLIRSTVLRELVGFTEKFFFGEEDFDFSLRMKKARAKMVCCLKSVIFHKVSATIDKNSKQYNLGKAYIHYLNRFINLKAHWPRFFWHGWRLFYIFYIYVLLGKQTECSASRRFNFIKKLLKDSLVLDRVDKEYFEDILCANGDFF